MCGAVTSRACRWHSTQYLETGQDITRRLHGEVVSLPNSGICEFTAAADVFIPLHSHPHEQVGYVMEGRVEFVCGDETFIAEPGYAYAIPGYVQHSARFLAPSKLVEVFCPPREEYR